MPVAVSQEIRSPWETQMELPIAVLLRRSRERRKQFPRVRGGSLPGRAGYHDDGCEIHPQCLTCPLPRCRYDEPGGLKGMLNGLRGRGIVALKSRGVAVEEIAGTFGVSRRRGFRVLTEKYKASRPVREVGCA